MNLRHRVQLSAVQREQLRQFTRQGEAKARELTRAQTLLLADRRTADQTIADALAISPRTVARTRQRFCEAGLTAALHERPRPGARPKLDERQSAQLFVIACSDPPEGHSQWTMHLLADRLVRLAVVASISDETVRRTLKKRGSVPA